MDNISIWDWFGKSGPLSNATTIILGGLTVFGWFRSWYLKRQVRDMGGEIAGLESTLGRWKAELSKLQDAQERASLFEARLPDTAVAKVEREWSDGNAELANEAVVDWIRKEGRGVSRLLLFRADWIHVHAALDMRADGLTAADAYATAAVVLCPENREAVDLRDQVERYWEEEAQASRPLTEILADFDQRATELYRGDEVQEAGRRRGSTLPTRSWSLPSGLADGGRCAEATVENGWP